MSSVRHGRRTTVSATGVGRADETNESDVDDLDIRRRQITACSDYVEQPAELVCSDRHLDVESSYILKRACSCLRMHKMKDYNHDCQHSPELISHVLTENENLGDLAAFVTF